MKTMHKKSNTLSSKKYENYLLNNKTQKGEEYTYTRIGSKDFNIFGGCYNFKDFYEFLDMYYQHVFENKNDEYLTEKQLLNDGPLLVDIDLRYSKETVTRLHSKEHIIDLIHLYGTKLAEIYDILDKTNINVYVLEKPNINKLDKITKDGIHLIFTISMNKSAQSLLRKKIIENIGNMWDNLPITNSYEDMIDEGVCKGFVNWQMYGSKKPGNEAYKLSYYYTLNYNKEEDIFDLKEISIEKFDIKEHLEFMSARNSNHIKLEYNNNSTLLENLKIEEKEINNKDTKQIKPNIISNSLNFDFYDYSKITNIEDLNNLTNIFLESLSYNDYELKELHNFTMILPEQYYGPGSYNKWIRVGWALKNTSEKLFITWIKFSSQYNNFNFSEISSFYNMWKSFEIKNKDGLTNRSIMYWAKNDNYEEYFKIRQETITYYIDQTLDSIIRKDKIGEFDLAIVLYQLFKDQFVCVSIKNNLWYEYKNHKWFEIDSGNTLRLLISKKMHDIYMKKAHDIIETITQMENNDQNTDSLKVKSTKLGDICILLKTTSWKNNIMREAKELFYDKEFLNRLDANPYLLCFNNYIIDFKNCIYRKGKPDDFISKSTNINYIPYEKIKSNTYYKETEDEINNFINQLFPNDELNRYMREHCASILIGTNENQTFNIYNGSGANGKSKFVELLSKGLGDYKATVPITLITQKRNSIGSTSSEIVQLQGVRYAVMQEPSKGEKINEGIMKEITGGDPIQGRALFKDTITFVPQFKLVVCTNVLFEINTNDDGTWRRIRLCDFMSKFNDDPYNDEEKFPKSNFPYQYKVDKKIDEKFESWAPVLMSMLVELAFKTKGEVKDAKIVLSVSDKYREKQDYLTEFAKEKIIRKTDAKIKKTELLEEFKSWFIMHNGRNNLPNGKEITDYMDKKYGKAVRGKWLNVEMCYDDDSDYEDYYE